MFDGKNYVAPGPQERQQAPAVAPVAPLAPKLLLDSHSQLVNLYADQYKQAAKPGEIVTDNDQNVSYRLSTSNELAERRRTARMYLLFLAGVNAMATTGVVALAYLSHMTSSTAQTVAVWLVLFGVVQSVLTLRHLRREQTLSPEGLHLEQIQYDAQVHQTDAQTRRLAIQYAGRAELERVRLQREEIAAQREANHRLAEEARAKVAQQMQRHTTPQHTLNRLNTYRPEPEQQPEQERRFLIVGCPDDWTDAQALATATAASALDLPPVEPITDTVRQRLLDFVTDLYLTGTPMAVTAGYTQTGD